MEKTASARNNGNFNENGKNTSQWTTDVVSGLMDSYKKQLDMTFKMYGNYLDSFLSESRGFMNSSDRFSSFFSNRNFFSPVLGMGVPSGVSESFLRANSDFLSRLIEFNRNLLESTGQQLERGSKEWNLLLERYQHSADASSEVLKNMIGLAAEASNRHIGIGLETNKQIQNEAKKFMNEVVRDSEAFWDEATNISGGGENEGSQESDKGSKKASKKEAQSV